jgi:predicted RNA-binding protein with PUA-like domain
LHPPYIISFKFENKPETILAEPEKKVKICTMNYWLIKSEPHKYSWDQMLKDKKTLWDGVRNYQARNNLREMKKGDLCLFYHSNDGKEIVGIVKVVKEYYQDPTTEDKNWVSVDVSPFATLKKTVTLAQIKSEPRLSGMALLKQMRLSVSPVKKEEFDLILELSEN